MFDLVLDIIWYGIVLMVGLFLWFVVSTLFWAGYYHAKENYTKRMYRSFRNDKTKPQ